jgi:hypothetical protein
MPRREIECAEHGEIPNPFLAQRLHEPAACAAHLPV